MEKGRSGDAGQSSDIDSHGCAQVAPDGAPSLRQASSQITASTRCPLYWFDRSKRTVPLRPIPACTLDVARVSY